jgi:hypothetical protein
MNPVPPVDKELFDALLGKMMQAPPQPKAAIEITKKAGKIIPATPPSKPHKA